MTWTIQEVARRTGLTSRALRHYDTIGLLPASDIGPGGLRRYDDNALARLQRILLLKDLGLGLPVIAEVLNSSDRDEINHLQSHLELLQLESDRLNRRINAVRQTITARKGAGPMTADMFDGFNHTDYQEEVEQRWGTKAYADADTWWRSKSAAEKADFKQEVTALSAAWVAAARDGESPTGERGQALAARHVAWLGSVPGSPAGSSAEQTAAYVKGLAQLYVDDERFAANYTGDSGEVTQGPAFVRDALVAFIDART